MSLVLATDVTGRSRSAILPETSLTVHDTDGKFPVRMEVPQKKVKSVLQQAMKAQGESGGIALPILELGARLEWSTPRPGRFTPGKGPRYTLYSRLSGPQARSGRVRITSPPPGFDPRPVQNVASRDTD